MNEKYFYVQNGKEKIKCRPLFDCHSDDYDRDYVLYTDDKKDKKGNIQIFASAYEIVDGEIQLTEIEDDTEFACLMNVFQDANKN